MVGWPLSVGVAWSVVGGASVSVGVGVRVSEGVGAKVENEGSGWVVVVGARGAVVLLRTLWRGMGSVRVLVTWVWVTAIVAAAAGRTRRYVIKVSTNTPISTQVDRWGRIVTM